MTAAGTEAPGPPPGAGAGTSKLDRLLCSLWLGEVAGVFAWCAQDLWSFATAQGLGAFPVAELFMSCLAGGLIGLAVGALAIMNESRRTDAAFSAARLARALLEPEPQAPLRVSAALYSAAFVAGSSLCAGFYLARGLIFQIANVDNLALALVGVGLGLLGIAAFVTVPVFRVVLGLLNYLEARLPRLRLTNQRLHLGIVFLAVGAVGAQALLHFRQSLKQLDWQPWLTTFAAVCLALFMIPALRRAPRWLIRCLAALGLVVCTASGVLGARQVANSESTRGLVAGIGYSCLAWLLDRDGDGFIDLHGARDCAPLDGAVHPGAIDVPNNAIDEDCDGVDAKAHDLRRDPPRLFHALPQGWQARPNLYLVTIDAFATSVLTCYGGSAEIAPNLEALAARSVVFENFFVQGPSTRLSLPSMFSSRFDSDIELVLKGRFPFEIAASNLMLAEVLGSGGYSTSAVLPDPYFLPERWAGLTQGFRDVAREPALAAAEGVPHTAARVTDSAIAALRRPRVSPGFFWIHYFDAHPPHEAPRGSTASGPDQALYRAEIGHLDHELGRLLEAIGQEDDNYFIIVTGDHGISFDPSRHHDRRYGHDLSTAVLHVPLIVYSPRLGQRRVRTLSHGLDIAPTLLNLAGMPAPTPFLGYSLVAAMLGQPAGLPSTRFAQFFISEDILRHADPLRMVSARTERYYMIADRRSGTFRAWEWQRDPREQRDLWRAHARGVANDHLGLVALKERLDSFTRESTGTPQATTP